MEQNQQLSLYEKLLLFEERKQENLNYIYLIKDSNQQQWYKAYEWSAYLLEFITNTLPENKRLNPIKKQIENTDKTIINVGFPLTSLNKFCEPQIIKNKNIDERQNICIQIILPNEITLSNYKEKLNEWKNLIQVKTFTQNKNNQKSTNIYSQPTTFLTIMKNIMKFNTYGRSQEELIQFIENLKVNCADLIC